MKIKKLTTLIVQLGYGITPGVFRRKWACIRMIVYFAVGPTVVVVPQTIHGAARAGSSVGRMQSTVR